MNNTTVKRLAYYFERFGHRDYIGEEISQVSHAVQCGNLARQLKPNDPHFISAAVLHDIGQLVGMEHSLARTKFGVLAHELVGANFLKHHRLHPKVCALVANHVNAKRYLVATMPQYVSMLSAASQATLKEQRGRMTFLEARKFEKTPYFQDSLILRALDDKAKSIDYVDPRIMAEFWPFVEQSILTKK